jgi:ribosomal protein S12 methylthiotransferase accessory factor
VSRRTGIVADVTFHELAADDPAFYWATSHPANVVPIGGSAARNEGNAASVDRDRAVLKAVGESVERYCSALYDERELQFATYEELDGDAVPPERFALFSDRQYAEPGFRFAPFTRTTPVRWARGQSLVHDRPTWVPAQLVYVPYTRDPREPPLRDLISTGLAAGRTFAAAAYRGTAELIERDAFMIVWQNRLPRPRIDLESVGDPFVERLLRAFRGVPVQLHAVLLTLDIDVPVVLIVMTSASTPLTTIGIGVDLSPRRALALALEEAGLGFVAVRWLAASTPDYRPEPGHRECVDLRRHALAHALDPTLRSSIEFLTCPGETLSLSELPDRSSEDPDENLRLVTSELAGHGFDVVAVDLTTPDVDEAGYKVVRSVVPGLQPLDDDHTCRHLGGTRLYSHQVRSELNPDPHPFP